MKSSRQWLLRLTSCAAIISLVVLAASYYAMSLPKVTESAGFTGVTPAAIECTLSGSLPASATNVRHCSASAGLSGRMLAYRFSGELSDLHRHAQAEFAAHWDAPQMQATSDATSPFDDCGSWPGRNTLFHTKTEWMVAPKDAVGTVYASEGNRGSQPIIFVDEKNGVLYFRMTD